MAVKCALTEFPVLCAPQWHRPFVLKTDASITCMGVALAQDFTYKHPELGVMVTRRHPIVFVSRATSGPEKRYAAFLLELVGVKWGLKKFHKYIFGQEIELVTDCEALAAGILSNHKVSPAHVRWREYILGHNIVKFTHQPGKLHTACKELSRRALNPSEPLTRSEPGLPLSWAEYVDLNLPGPECAAELSADRVPSQAQAEELREDLTADPSLAQSAAGLGTLEDSFSVLFLEEGSQKEVLRARFRHDTDLGPIVKYLLTLQLPAGISRHNTGRLCKSAKNFSVRPTDLCGTFSTRCPRVGSASWKRSIPLW